MRILKTTQTYYPYLSKGGPPVKVRGIAKALARRGHQVTVLTACFNDAEPDVPLNAPTSLSRSGSWISQDKDLEAVYLSTLVNYRATTINPRVVNFCLKRLRDFDVVHIYGLYDLLGSVVAWFCRRRGIPYVLEPLGMFGPKVRSQKKKRLYRRLVGNALFQGAAVVIATSETERAELIAGGIAEAKIVLRRNGLDLGEFETLPPRGAFRAKLGLSEQQPLLFFLGRLSFIKGLDLLVQAFSQIDALRALPDGRASAPTCARLVIAGPDDDDGCAQTIRGLIDQLQLRGRVILTGPLYGNERLQAFIDADVFVLPSRYESFGNAAAESLACGTPVLVTDTCGIAPLVDGRSGLVVACDVEGLRDGMNSLLKDRSLFARLRDGCAGVAQSLSWDAPVEQMERIYERAKSKEVRAKGKEREGEVRELGAKG
jgi:glycosyltransferase involved in cell wall biosynthesis